MLFSSYYLPYFSQETCKSLTCLQNFINVDSLYGAEVELKQPTYYIINSTNARLILTFCASLKKWKLYIAGTDTLYLNIDYSSC